MNKSQAEPRATVTVRTLNSVYEFDQNTRRVRGGIIGSNWRPGTILSIVWLPMPRLQFSAASDEGYEESWTSSEVQSVEFA